MDIFLTLISVHKIPNVPHAEIPLLAIIAKYGVLIREWGYLLDLSMSKRALWRNVHVDDWIVELAIIASSVTAKKLHYNHVSHSFELQKNLWFNGSFTLHGTGTGTGTGKWWVTIGFYFTRLGLGPCPVPGPVQCEWAISGADVIEFLLLPFSVHRSQSKCKRIRKIKSQGKGN